MVVWQLRCQLRWKQLYEMGYNQDTNELFSASTLYFWTYTSFVIFELTEAPLVEPTERTAEP
jgi:hypothetical protein